MTAKRIPAAICVLGLTATVGCSSVRLQRADYERVHTVLINRSVAMEEPIDLGGPALEGYEPFPPHYFHVPVMRELTLVYAITPPGLWQISRANARMDRAFTLRMQTSNVDVREITRHAFEKELRASRLFPEVRSRAFEDDALPDAEGTVRLDLELFVEVAPGFLGLAAGSRPWIELEGTLRDHSGRVICRERADLSGGAENIPHAENQKFFNDPQSFRIAYSIAARQVARELVKKIAGH